LEGFSFFFFPPLFFLPCLAQKLIGDGDLLVFFVFFYIDVRYGSSFRGCNENVPFLLFPPPPVPLQFYIVPLFSSFLSPPFCLVISLLPPTIWTFLFFFPFPSSFLRTVYTSFSLFSLVRDVSVLFFGGKWTLLFFFPSPASVSRSVFSFFFPPLSSCSLSLFSGVFSSPPSSVISVVKGVSSFRWIRCASFTERAIFFLFLAGRPGPPSFFFFRKTFFCYDGRAFPPSSPFRMLGFLATVSNFLSPFFFFFFSDAFFFCPGSVTLLPSFF